MIPGSFSPTRRLNRLSWGHFCVSMTVLLWSDVPRFVGLVSHPSEIAVLAALGLLCGAVGVLAPIHRTVTLWILQAANSILTLAWMRLFCLAVVQQWMPAVSPMLAVLFLIAMFHSLWCSRLCQKGFLEVSQTGGVTTERQAGATGTTTADDQLHVDENPYRSPSAPFR